MQHDSDSSKKVNFGELIGQPTLEQLQQQAYKKQMLDQVRQQAAIQLAMSMATVAARDDNFPLPRDFARRAVQYATALVQELFKEEE